MLLLIVFSYNLTSVCLAILLKILTMRFLMLLLLYDPTRQVRQLDKCNSMFCYSMAK